MRARDALSRCTGIGDKLSFDDELARSDQQPGIVHHAVVETAVEYLDGVAVVLPIDVIGDSPADRGEHALPDGMP